LRQKG
jgi:pleiotropic regulator 1